jgi:hypothetical protein
MSAIHKSGESLYLGKLTTNAMTVIATASVASALFALRLQPASTAATYRITKAARAPDRPMPIPKINRIDFTSKSDSAES